VWRPHGLSRLLVEALFHFLDGVTQDHVIVLSLLADHRRERAHHLEALRHFLRRLLLCLAEVKAFSALDFDRIRREQVHISLRGKSLQADCALLCVELLG